MHARIARRTAAVHRPQGGLNTDPADGACAPGAAIR